MTHKVLHHAQRHSLHFYDGWLIAVQVRIFGATYTVAKGAKFREAPTELQRKLNDALPASLRPMQHRVSSWDFVAAYTAAQQGHDLRAPLGYPVDDLLSLGVVLGLPQPLSPDGRTKRHLSRDYWGALGKRLEHAIKFTGLEPKQHRTLWVWDWS